MRRSVHPVRAALRAVEGAGDSANTKGLFAMDHDLSALLSAVSEALSRIPNHVDFLDKGRSHGSQFFDSLTYGPDWIPDVISGSVEPPSDISQRVGGLEFR